MSYLIRSVTWVASPLDPDEGERNPFQWDQYDVNIEGDTIADVVRELLEMHMVKEVFLLGDEIQFTRIEDEHRNVVYDKQAHKRKGKPLFVVDYYARVLRVEPVRVSGQDLENLKEEFYYEEV
jgi:hypothetical protein